jgi:hypothetical protein
MHQALLGEVYSLLAVLVILTSGSHCADTADSQQLTASRMTIDLNICFYLVTTNLATRDAAGSMSDAGRTK